MSNTPWPLSFYLMPKSIDAGLATGGTVVAGVGAGIGAVAFIVGAGKDAGSADVFDAAPAIFSCVRP